MPPTSSGLHSEGHSVAPSFPSVTQLFRNGKAGGGARREKGGAATCES